MIEDAIEARCQACNKLLARIDPAGSALVQRRCPRCRRMSEIALLDDQVTVDTSTYVPPARPWWLRSAADAGTVPATT